MEENKPYLIVAPSSLQGNHPAVGGAPQEFGHRVGGGAATHHGCAERCFFSCAGRIHDEPAHAIKNKVTYPQLAPCSQGKVPAGTLPLPLLGDALAAEARRWCSLQDETQIQSMASPVAGVRYSDRAEELIAPERINCFQPIIPTPGASTAVEIAISMSRPIAHGR